MLSTWLDLEDSLCEGGAASSLTGLMERNRNLQRAASQSSHVQSEYKLMQFF